MSTMEFLVFLTVCLMWLTLVCYVVRGLVRDAIEEAARVAEGMAFDAMAARIRALGDKGT
jgi:hypothetical protein